MKYILAILVCILPLSIHAYSLKELENSIKNSDCHLCEQIINSDITITPQDLARLISLSNNVIEQRKIEYSSLDANYILSLIGLSIGGALLLKILSRIAYSLANYIRHEKIDELDTETRERLAKLIKQVNFPVYKKSILQRLINISSLTTVFGLSTASIAYAYITRNEAKKKRLLCNAIEINYLLLQYQSNCSL